MGPSSPEGLILASLTRLERKKDYLLYVTYLLVNFWISYLPHIFHPNKNGRKQEVSMSHKNIFGIVDCSMRLGQDGVRAHMVLGCARFGLR